MKKKKSFSHIVKGSTFKDQSATSADGAGAQASPDRLDSPLEPILLYRGQAGQGSS